jgi:Aromatic-ring hydroxylase, C-terminal
LALVRPRWGRAARNAISAALLGVPPIADRIAELISGIGVRYPAPPGSDPLVGTRAPDIALRDGRTLYDALRGGRFVLLSPATAGLPDPVDAAEPARGDGHGRSLLIRPDGYVAWAGAPDRFAAWAGGYFRTRRDVRTSRAGNP